MWLKRVMFEMRSKWQERASYVNNWETAFQTDNKQVQRPCGRNKCRIFGDQKASVAMGGELKLVT